MQDQGTRDATTTNFFCPTVKNSMDLRGGDDVVLGSADTAAYIKNLRRLNDLLKKDQADVTPKAALTILRQCADAGLAECVPGLIARTWGPSNSATKTAPGLPDAPKGGQRTDQGLPVRAQGSRAQRAPQQRHEPLGALQPCRGHPQQGGARGAQPQRWTGLAGRGGSETKVPTGGPAT